MSTKENLSDQDIIALQCARRERRLIYTYAGFFNVNGGRVFPVSGIRRLIQHGFMRIAGVWTVEITEEGELFVNACETRKDENRD